MKRKIYSVLLIVTIAIMASSCNGCKGNTNQSSGDSTKQDSQAKDSTFPKPGPKQKTNSAHRDSAANQDSSAKDSTFPKPGPKGKAKAKAN